MLNQMNKGALVCLLGCALGLGACVEEAAPVIDEAKVAEMRAALPNAELLSARAPSAAQAEAGSVEQGLVGERAIYPAMAGGLVQSVNGSVSDMIRLLEKIVALPPTQFNEAEKAAVWGPFDNNEGVGQIAVIIQDHGEDRDEHFRFTYVFGRLIEGGDLTPVISGGATPNPDNDDFGEGATLWDFEANAAFEDAHNPNHGDLDRGRFITLYGKDKGEDDPDSTATLVLALFRGFVPDDKASEAPIDLDYFYGRVETSEHKLDFLNFAASFDLNPDEGSGAIEDLDVQMVFLDQGRGRAEVQATGGDIEAEPGVDALTLVECWDKNITETFLGMSVIGEDGTAIATEDEGDAASCAPIFDKELDELDIPSLDDVDQGILDALDELATKGLP